jgi:hypothetical protein
MSAAVQFAFEAAQLVAFSKGVYSQHLADAADSARAGQFRAARHLADLAFAEYRDLGLVAWVIDVAGSCANDRGGAEALRLVGPLMTSHGDKPIGAHLLRRMRELLLPDAPPPMELRFRVAEHIEAHPMTHDQRVWGTGAPSCGTPQCAAGWLCSLGGGTRGLDVSVAALVLSHVDGEPDVTFDGHASWDSVLASLRGEVLTGERP